MRDNKEQQNLDKESDTHNNKRNGGWTGNEQEMGKWGDDIHI